MIGTLVVSVVLATAGLAVDAGMAPAEEPTPGAAPGAAAGVKNGRIAFDSTRDGNPEIYSMNPDGSDVRRLTDDPAHDFDPDFSPDGSKIAFVRYADGNYAVHVMDADGSDVRRLTDAPADYAGPAFSPDGTKIAFFDAREGTLHAVGVDGSGMTRLTAAGPGSDSLPAWSPDGTKIAFASSRDGVSSDIWVVETSGGEPQKLAGDAHNDDVAPAWSPDGTRIAYESLPSQWSPPDGGPGRKAPGVYVSDAPGGGGQDVLLAEGGASAPAWSPDGERIALVVPSGTGGGTDREVFTVDADDGSNAVNLTNNPANDGYPDWGPGANSAPKVTRVSPAPGSGIRDRTPTIRATVRDAEDDLAKADMRLYLDGRRVYRFSYDRETDRLSYASRRLSYGAHAVKITAADPEGLRAAKSWRFRVRR